MSNNGEVEVLKHFDDKFFGKLTPLIADAEITDINCNSHDVWVNHIFNGRYRSDIEFTAKDINELAYRISNTENTQFNAVNPILDADLYDLRFNFTHESFSVSGPSVSIRKTPVTNRIKDNTMEQKTVDYLSPYAVKLLTAAVKCRQNFVICGLTGSGKTELAKYLIGKTVDNERIITIEDVSELHLPQIYPTKDVVELKVNDFVDYDKAIASCMRMLPIWVILSEARGKEVQELIKCISTGAKIITTLHTDDARQIPNRILNMFSGNELSNDKIEGMIYDYIDLGVHVKVENVNGKTTRYVNQIVYFDRTSDHQNVCYTIYSVKKDSNQNYVTKEEKLPNSLNEIFESNGIYLTIH